MKLFILSFLEIATVLAEAVQIISDVPDSAARKRLVTALAVSLTLDEQFRSSSGEAPRIKGANEIAELCGVGIPELEHFGVVLRRKKIKEFAAHYGRVLRSSDITKLFKTEAYTEFFQKEISRAANGTNQSATIYTRAEILQRIDYGGQIPLSARVETFFRDNDVVFPLLDPPSMM